MARDLQLCSVQAQFKVQERELMSETSGSKKAGGGNIIPVFANRNTFTITDQMRHDFSL